MSNIVWLQNTRDRKESIQIQVKECEEVTCMKKQTSIQNLEASNPFQATPESS
jgi:hypothetical protein